MTDRELMQQALEALEETRGGYSQNLIAALRERLAQPEQDAVLAEREACAELVWPTQQIKTWSEDELTAMTGAFNRAQEKHGWYETIMAVGAAALKDRAAAIRARGQG